MDYWISRLYDIPMWQVTSMMREFWYRRRGRFSQRRRIRRYHETRNRNWKHPDWNIS
jgi:hypothetical protein